MIYALIIFNLILTFILFGGILYIYLNAKDVFKLKDDIKKIHEDIDYLKEKTINLEHNPAEFTKRFTLVDLKIKQIENVIETFNHGFNPNQSYMM